MTKFSRLDEAERNIRVDIGEGEFYIMVNPTPGDVVKLVRGKSIIGVGGARGVITSDGTLYVWSLQQFYEHDMFFKHMAKYGVKRTGSAVFYIEESVNLDDVFDLMNRNTKGMTGEEIVKANNTWLPGITAFESVVQGSIGTGKVGMVVSQKVVKHPKLAGVDFFYSNGTDRNANRVGEPILVRATDKKKFIATFNEPGKWQDFVEFISI